MHKRVFFVLFSILVFSVAFAAASTPTPKPFEYNSMIDFTFSKGSAYTLLDDNLDNKLYFSTPAKDVSIRYFQGGSEVRAVLHNVGRIDVWPKFSSMQFDNESQSSSLVVKAKRTTAQTPVQFRAVFYEGKQTPPSRPYVAPPITTPIEPPVPGVSASPSCDFVYGAKTNAGEVEGFKLSERGKASEFKSVVFGQDEKVDYSYLWPSTESVVKKVNAKKIELLTSTKDAALKKNEGISTEYSFSSPVLMLVTPENGKQFVAAVTKLTFSSKAGLETSAQFGSPDFGNFKLNVGADSLAIKSRDKPFSLDLTPQQKVSSLSWDPSGASCYQAYVQGNPVWVKNFGFETSPTYVGSRSGNAAGCESQAGRCDADTSAKFYTFKFPSKTNVTLESCSVLSDNLEVSKGKLGEVTLETVAIFLEQPKVVFNDKKVEFQYSLKQGDEKSFALNNALWNVVYDPSSFDYYHELNAKGGVPSSVPRHDDAKYTPKNYFCPARDKNSFSLSNSGDYLARLWIAGTGKNVVLEEKLVRLVTSGENFGQFLLTSSDVAQKNFQFNTNNLEAKDAPKYLLFNNVLYSIFSISPGSHGLAASFLARAKETSTGKSVLELVNPPAFGAVGKIPLKNFYFTGSKISFGEKANKFEGIAFTVLQPKSVGEPAELCDSSLYAPGTSDKKCLEAAPFCWGAYLGKYRCYPTATGNGFAAVDAYACKGVAIKSSDGKVSEYGTVYLRYAPGKGYCSTGVKAKELQAQGACEPTSEKISYAITKDGKTEDHAVEVWDCTAGDIAASRAEDAKTSGVSASGGRTTPAGGVTGAGTSAAGDSRDRARVSAKTPAEKVKECRSKGTGYECRNKNACDTGSIKPGVCPGNENNVCCKTPAYTAKEKQCLGKTILECTKAALSTICKVLDNLCVPSESAAASPSPKPTVTSRAVKLVPSDRLCETYSSSQCRTQSLRCEIAYAGSATYCTSKTCSELSVSDCRKLAACEVTHAGSSSYCTARTCSELSLSICREYDSCQVVSAGGDSYCTSKTCEGLSTSDCSRFPECKLTFAGGERYCTSK